MTPMLRDHVAGWLIRLALRVATPTTRDAIRSAWRFPPYGREWDGHDTAEKNRRLHRFIHLGELGTDDGA